LLTVIQSVDSYDRPPTTRAPSFTASGIRSRISTRGISVDKILQNASQIPSGQSRTPPGRRPTPLIQRRYAGIIGTGPRIAQQNVLGRTTKVSEKLVLIPETVNEKEDSDGWMYAQGELPFN